MRSSILACLGFVWAGAVWAQPIERVEFDSAGTPLSAFQERRARERGETPTPIPGVRLEGYLAKPSGEGPFPGVVVLPGCAGLTAYVKETLPQLLASWGYVALVVDSLATRKLEPNCVKDHASVNRLADAYGGLFHLAVQPFIDRNRVGVLGVSIGGKMALVLADPNFETVVANPDKLKLRAGVAFYPTCTVADAEPVFPLFILGGREDPSMRISDCEGLVSRRARDRVRTELITYPGVYHGFIERDWATPQEMFGMRFEYNETAAADALQRTREFLDRNVKG
jgi:dienelactone hydrolase